MTAFGSRMHQVQSPIIPVVGQLIREHPGTISLGQGVVSYGPPSHAIATLAQHHQSLDNHKYQPVQGIAPLLEVIAAKLKTDNQIEVVGSSRIVVTAGSNMGFMNAVLAITEPGDEIILQTPYYFNHEMAITMASCRAVCVPTDENYQLRLDAIANAITERTRAIVTISPNNPTGAVYPAADLAAVNQLCGDHNLYHISDEAYEYFTYGGVEHVSPGRFQGAAAHTISLYSLSKAYGFASWRIGYMVIPERLWEAIQKIQDTILICPPVISQYAALGALQVGRDYCLEQRLHIAQVRQQVLSALQAVEAFCRIPQADGAFYILLEVDTHLSAMTVVERLIAEYGIAVIPGDTFGMTGCYLRISFGALQGEELTVGIRRLVAGLIAIAG